MFDDKLDHLLEYWIIELEYIDNLRQKSKRKKFWEEQYVYSENQIEAIKKSIKRRSDLNYAFNQKQKNI